MISLVLPAGNREHRGIFLDVVVEGDGQSVRSAEPVVSKLQRGDANHNNRAADSDGAGA